MRLLSNKKKGSNFEEEFAELLSKNGFWAHVIAPNPKDGSQPFDVQAQKYGKAYNFDCKTVNGYRFLLRRIEENQEKAFTKLASCGNHNNYFAFKRSDGSIWITDAYFCISEKQAGLKSVEPGIVTVEEWIERENNRR